MAIRMVGVVAGGVGGAVAGMGGAVLLPRAAVVQRHPRSCPRRRHRPCLPGPQQQQLLQQAQRQAGVLVL